jgi:hypothetical protein
VSKIRILILIMLAVAASACQFSFSTARIVDAQTSKQVNEKKEAVDLTSVFEATDKIHCVVRLANAPSSTKIRAQWYAVNAQGQKPNEKLDETTMNEIGANNIIDFNYTPSPDGLPAGNYRVDIFLNPKDKGEDKPAKTVTFTVKPTDGMAVGPQVARAFLSTDQEGQIEVTEYEAGTDAFYTNVVIKGAVRGTKVTGKWIAEEVSDVAPNTELRSMSYSLKGKENLARFSLTYPKGFGAGRYRIEIYINDSAESAASVPFAVE